MRGIHSVSYTHLDVYKRQQVGWLTYSYTIFRNIKKCMSIYNIFIIVVVVVLTVICCELNTCPTFSLLTQTFFFYLLLL